LIENTKFSRTKKNFKDIEKNINNDSKKNSSSLKNLNPKTPKLFFEQFELIRKMRDEARAPVDDMGVECTIESNTDRPTYKFQTLVSLILSAQTNDKVTFSTMKKLLDYGLTVDSIAKISEKNLVEMIYGVNFHNNKAQRIIIVNF